MLISANEIQSILTQYGISVTGVLHIGAHDCEELGIYQSLGIAPEQVIWIDAMSNKVEQATKRGIPNVYHAVISDQNDTEVVFHVANNGQSSSILEMGTHSSEYPDIFYVNTLIQRSTTLSSFFQTHGLDSSRYSFWNFDIQGAELLALKGGEALLPHVTAIYLEVNQAELYIGCGKIGEVDEFLSTHGFTRMLTRMTGHGWGDALYVRTHNKA
jgi:FkbM family methyltransferase